MGVVNNSKITAEKILIAFALAFYVTASFGALTVLFTKGSVFFPLVFVGAWVTDTFAYFTGFFFGKHKIFLKKVCTKSRFHGTILYVFQEIYADPKLNMKGMVINHEEALRRQNQRRIRT